jgi:hypothetical protein
MSKTETAATPKKIDGTDIVTVIVSRGGNTVQVRGSYKSKKYKVDTFESLASGDDISSARTNALSMVVDTIEKAKVIGIDGIMNVYTIGLVANAAQNGTFKHWLATGTNRDGVELSAKELELWGMFADLMFDKDIGMHVNVLDVPTQNQQQRYDRAHNSQNQNRGRNNSRQNNQRQNPDYEFLLQITNAAWDKAEAPTATVAEVNDADFGF